MAGVANGTSYVPVNTFLVRPVRTELKDDYIAAATALTATSPPDIEKTTTFSYDDYSNQTRVVTATIGGITDTVKAQYDNIPGLWLLGEARHVEHSRTDAAGLSVTQTTDFSYYPNGRLMIKTTEPQGGADLRTDEEYFYDSFGNLGTRNVMGKVDGAATQQTRRTVTTYDATGIYPYQVSNSYGHKTTFTYDPKLDVQIAAVDANGVGTDFVYDRFGRRRGVFPDGAQATWSVLRVGGELGGADGRTVDPTIAFRESVFTSQSDTPSACTPVQTAINGRCFADVRRRQVDHRGNSSVEWERDLARNWWETRRSFDERNQVKSVGLPIIAGKGTAPATTFLYDALGRLVQRQEPNLFAKTWQYPDRFKTIEKGDVNDDVAKTIDKDGRLTLTEEVVTDAIGLHPVRTQFTNDAFGNVLTATRTDRSGANLLSRYTYDTLGRPKTSEEPAAGVQTTYYTAFGEHRQESDALGTRTLTWDVLGRLTRRAESATAFESYNWDTAAGSGIGKLESMQRMPDNVVQFYEYDGPGRLSGRRMATTGGDYRMAFSYDSEGRPSKMFFPAPPLRPNRRVNTWNYYDEMGQLNAVTIFDGAEEVNIWYLPESSPVRTREIFGDDSTTENIVIDPTTGRLSDINIVAGASTRNIHYTYHPNGKVAAAQRAAVSDSYVYDELDRLKSWTHTFTSLSTPLRREYSYNDFGDLTGTKTFNALTGGTQTASETYSFGVATPRVIPSAVKSDGVNSYGYDLLGRRTTKTTTGAPAPESVVYNHWNLPSSVGSPNGTMTFKYDADGRRAVKTFNGETTYYLDDLFEDRVATDGKHTFVMHLKVDDDTVAEVSQGASSATSAPVTTSFLHQDALGSASIVTSGTIKVGIFHEPFGARITSAGVPDPSIDAVVHHDFTGHERDQLGLMNMGGRARPGAAALPVARPRHLHAEPQPGLQPVQLRAKQSDQPHRPHRVVPGRRVLR